jgi:hypothetical protein
VIFPPLQRRTRTKRLIWQAPIRVYVFTSPDKGASSPFDLPRLCSVATLVSALGAIWAAHLRFLLPSDFEVDNGQSEKSTAWRQRRFGACELSSVGQWARNDLAFWLKPWPNGVYLIRSLLSAVFRRSCLLSVLCSLPEGSMPSCVLLPQPRYGIPCNISPSKLP